MEKVLELLNRMQAEGTIENFAIGGGIATIYYLEAYVTDDIDVFISPVVVGEGGLISFGHIYRSLEEFGYIPEREYIRIEDWLVQFVPASESVQEEAVEAHIGSSSAQPIRSSSWPNTWLRNCFDQVGARIMSE